MGKFASEYLGKAVITEVVPVAQQSNYVVGRPAYVSTPVQKAQENVNQQQADYVPTPAPAPQPDPIVPVVETDFFKKAWTWVKDNPTTSLLIAGALAFVSYKLFKRK